MEWLLRSQYLTPETNELAIHWKRMSIDMHDIYQIIQEILIRCGASLTHLLLEYPRTFPAHDIMGISLQNNTALRDLCLHFTIAYLPMIVFNISTLPPHCISRLILQCSDEVLKHTPPSPEWARLDKLLAEGAAFASLTEVVLGSQDSPVDKERMVQMMPTLNGQNLLTLAVIGGWDWGRDASDFWVY
ncbi:hypothetical protein QCA50_019896 [Cerrena zonata]|uniref:Uncharacterized protein n=1 Tax=Cerrena zonata TaxID=2478898 RepID=A0AAW0FJ18_9APHY